MPEQGDRNPSAKGSERHARHWARRLALQAIYQWQLSGSDLSEIEGQFAQDPNAQRADFPYFQEILHGVPARLRELDQALSGAADREMDQIDPVERAILRNASYELAYRLDVPYRVVINEAVDLAKKFGAEQGQVFVNAALDRVTRLLRPLEGRGGPGAGAPQTDPIDPDREV